MFLLRGLFVGIPLVCAADSFQVYHRLYQPGQPESPFISRGTIHIPANSDASFEPTPSLSQDLTQFAQELQTIKGALYQIALEQNGDSVTGRWDMASAVKVCHLHQASSETFIIHTTHGGQPYALDYFVSPTPHDGACSKKSKAFAPLLSFASNIGNLNITVSLRSPRLPPLPELRVPPPLTPEGEEIVPVPEKSLFARYWMYGLAILIALMLSGGAEEEAPKK
ncbi:hypothetical protein C8R43DRAFT_972280 [Mycena crocata]|nr:hypothetical protein C8R43DRAFT_972280 [Mycena crocata]